MLSEIDREAAELEIERERDLALARARRALKAEGTLDCVDCGVSISLQRRKACPSARRCILCQSAVEVKGFG